MANNGYAQAEVPVTVRTGYGSGATSVTQRILVPARGKAVQRILIQGKPTQVQVNDGTVPENLASVHVTSSRSSRRRVRPRPASPARRNSSKVQKDLIPVAGHVSTQAAEKLNAEGGGGFNPRIANRMSEGFSPGGNDLQRFVIISGSSRRFMMLNERAGTRSRHLLRFCTGPQRHIG